MTPEALIDLYNTTTARLLRGRQRPVSHCRSRIAEARKLSEWFVRHRINPKHWMIARHEWTGWTHRIAFSALNSPSERFRDAWTDWLANRYAEWDAEKRDRANVTADTNRVQSTTILGEAQKAAFAEHDEPELCMLTGRSLTGGWHPDSVWCSECALSTECRMRLPPNIRLRREANARSK